MKTILRCALLALLPISSLAQHGHEGLGERVFSKVLFEEFEYVDHAGADAGSWEGHAWVGRDLRRVWFKTKGERSSGSTEQAELQVLFSRAISAFWDLQAGIRHDFEPVGRDWAVLSARGLAPYFVEVEGSLFVGEGGRAALRVKSTYDLWLTQRIVLTPSLEANLYSRDDPAAATGSGLGDIDLGLRLHYEIRRELAPYVGVERVRLFGSTADLARAASRATGDTRWLVGIRFWF